jgi:hypothetical protein
MFVEQAKKQRSCRATTYILCRSYGTRLVIDKATNIAFLAELFEELSLCQ